jgi:hypothetical protein
MRGIGYSVLTQFKQDGVEQARPPAEQRNRHDSLDR